MTEGKRPRLVGINHVAIEVGNVDDALDWYGRIFDFHLRGKSEGNAFIDMAEHVILERRRGTYCSRRRDQRDRERHPARRRGALEPVADAHGLAARELRRDRHPEPRVPRSALWTLPRTCLPRWRAASVSFRVVCPPGVGVAVGVGVAP